MRKNKLLLIFIIIITIVSALTLFNSYQEIKHTYIESKESISLQQNKRNFLTQMFDASRERSLILLNMFGINDPFELDELNQKLSEQASIFIAAKESFSEFSLSKKELELLHIQNGLVSKNALVQTKVSQLLLDGKRDEAKDLLFDQALPGQNIVFDHIKLFLSEDEKAINNTIESLTIGIEQSGKIFLLLGLLLIIVSLFVINNINEII